MSSDAKSIKEIEEALAQINQVDFLLEDFPKDLTLRTQSCLTVKSH